MDVPVVIMLSSAEKSLAAAAPLAAGPASAATTVAIMSV